MNNFFIIRVLLNSLANVFHPADSRTIENVSLSHDGLEGEPVVFRESQFFEVRQAGVPEHRGGSAHEHLGVLRRSVEEAVRFDHVLGDEPLGPLPRSVGGRSIEGVVNLEFVGVVPDHFLDLLAAQNILFGCGRWNDAIAEKKENETKTKQRTR